MAGQTLPRQNISMSGIEGAGQVTIYQYFTASPYFAGFVNHNSPEMQTFLNVFKDLPDGLREYLASDETALLIFSIGQDSGLDDEQIHDLAANIRELIMGNIFIKDFPSILATKLNIIDPKAGELANKLIAKSFGPILDDVKRIQRSKFPDKITELRKEGQSQGLNRPTPTPAQQKPLPTLPPKNTEQQNGGSSTSQSNQTSPREVGTLKMSARPPQNNVRPITPPNQGPKPLSSFTPRPPSSFAPSSLKTPEGHSKATEDKQNKSMDSASPKPFNKIQDKPPITLNQRPDNRSQQNQPTQKPGKPFDKAPSSAEATAGRQGRPEFKVPNLGPSFASPSAKAMGDKEATKGKPDFDNDNAPLPQKKPDLDLGGDGDGSPEKTKQDIEKELEKVAGTIDLRSKSNN